MHQAASGSTTLAGPERLARASGHRPNRLGLRALAAWAGLIGGLALAAQPLPDDPLERRCWLGYTAARTAVDLREPTAVGFSNLREGYTVRSPLWVEFGVRGKGVIPAGNPHERAGHHHLLIDTPLPKDHREKIPFSQTHVHFGKGQTGAKLELAPGRHTLRLLFADHEHRPYFVYSPEITLTVSERRDAPALVIDPRNFAPTCASWYQDKVSEPRPAAREVYFKNVRDGEPVSSPFVLSLGVAGYGVAPADRPVKDTGHFAIAVERSGSLVTRRVLADGRTETLFDLPPGDYDLRLSLLGSGGSSLLSAPALRLVVAGAAEARSSVAKAR